LVGVRHVKHSILGWHIHEIAWERLLRERNHRVHGLTGEIRGSGDGSTVLRLLIEGGIVRFRVCKVFAVHCKYGRIPRPLIKSEDI